MAIEPANLRIQIYPTEILRVKADEVDPTPEVRAVAQRMIDLMRGAEGIGLAATQAGLPWRMFVAELPSDPEADAPEGVRVATDGPEAYLNPVIDTSDGAPTLFEEGCLSLPGIRGELPRPPTVTMSWTDLEGQRHTASATGLLARCWQHEIDHLDGVLIIDKMTQLSRTKVRSAVKALERR
ncbi:MAG: peptide deformylase [Planctomycetota bacterium]